MSGFTDNLRETMGIAPWVSVLRGELYSRGCGEIARSPLLVFILLASQTLSSQALAQTYVLTTPIFQTIDENMVSLTSGRTQIRVPVVEIGGLSFKTNNTTGIGLNSVYDENYGRVISCLIPAQYGGTAGMTGECAGATIYSTVQTILGQARANFSYINGQYVPEQTTGETLIDSGGYCTWTRKNGEQIKFYAIHESGNPLCLARNVAQVIYPNGRVIDYHYSGSPAGSQSMPILSLTSNDGFMLKYNYSGAIAIGAQNSVVGINRAFQACDPDALTCSLSSNWPTGTFVFQAGPGSGVVYNVVITSQKQEKHVFGLDNIYRLITYQPPGADGPLYSYTLCTPGLYNPASQTTPLSNCFGQSTWHHLWNLPNESSFFDQVQNVTKNGQTWGYGAELTPAGEYPTYMKWSRSAASPLGVVKSSWGSTTPNDYRFGATAVVFDGTGTYYEFAKGLNNPLVKQVAADGGYFEFGYDGRNNVTSISQHPSSGSAAALTRTASYPASCGNMKTCNQPDYYIDAKSYRTDLTYDPNHGGVLTETGPAVNGIRPQKRFTYVQRYAWYLNASGVMTRETRPIWVLNSESHCISSAASGAGCSAANDEVVTTYEYGPDSGPNNLLVRGQAVTWNGQTRRTCVGHDRYGNKIWESAPKAAPVSCAVF